jgi:hypothetical protein
MKTKQDLVNLGIEGFKADEIMLLQEKMMEQAVKFQFRKKDGSIRDAVGTRNRELMVLPSGEKWMPVGPQKPECPTTIGYWDLEKQMWRSFTCTEFIGLAEA